VCARARIASGSILCSSFNYSSQCCESTGAFLSRKGYASCWIVVFNLLHSTSVNLCNCHCFASRPTAARNSVWSCGNFFTQPRPQNHNTSNSVRSIYDFPLYVSVNRVTIIREKNASTQSTIFFAYLFYVINEGLHNLHSSVRDGFQVHISS
jgi:hypothetical protein